jgi:hypothetical protein
MRAQRPTDKRIEALHASISVSDLENHIFVMACSLGSNEGRVGLERS